MRIEITGGIASGKTTLANLLAQEGMQIILEYFKDNPFWADFYTDPSLFSFETEATFLLQHYSSLKKFLHSDKGLVVCDYSIFQDLAYAKFNLSAGEYAAFMGIYEEVRRQLSDPTLLIHLRCSAEEELRRIRQRNRQEEGEIEIAYLESLNDSIVEVVASEAANCRVLAIDSEELDFVSDSKTKERVVDEIECTLRDITA